MKIINLLLIIRAKIKEIFSFVLFIFT